MSEAAIRSEAKPEVIYRSEVRATPAGGGVKLVSLPHEAEPVPMGMHGAIAAHYKLPDGSYTPRAATLDYLQIDAVGEHEVEDGVVVLRCIHVTAHLRAKSSQRETVERVFALFASQCPVHRSIQKAIDITTELDFQSTDAT